MQISLPIKKFYSDIAIGAVWQSKTAFHGIAEDIDDIDEIFKIFNKD